jgi:hypothetical protein
MWLWVLRGFNYLRGFFTLLTLAVHLFPMLVSLMRAILTGRDKAERKQLMTELIRAQKAAAWNAQLLELEKEKLEMEKQVVLDMISAAKVTVVEAMDKLAADVAASEDTVPPSDDEEKVQLKAKVAELEQVVVSKDEVIAAKNDELVAQKDLLAQADVLAKKIDAAIPDAPVEG